MNAEWNKSTGPRPREGTAKEMERLDLESVIERARARDVEAPSSELSPLAAVINTEERAHVRDAIARLPENYRVPLVLRYYSELSYDEIAQQLNLQRNYVAALIFRAKQELRRKLSRGGK